MAEDPLVWIDLEMTGLDTARHTIVEIAVLVTDSDLAVVDDGIDIVIHQPPDALAAMDDYVRTMHTKSGLIRAIKASTTSLTAGGAEVLDYIKAHAPKPGRAPLCGNSIGMDRRFLDRYLPDVDQYLHYRSIDVSSFKELCRRWYPAVFKDRPAKKGAHRALDDIRESLDELRYYRAHMLRAPASSSSAPSSVVTEDSRAE